MKLDQGDLRLLQLALKGAGPDGWAKVSKVVWPAVMRLPDDLVEKQPSEDGGRVRLTERGDAIVTYC